MAGRKNIVLLNGNGKMAGGHYCYRHLQSAVRRASKLAVEERKITTIWHNDEGVELCVVRPDLYRTQVGFSVQTDHPRKFKEHWSN